jgi:hypothetical protein
VIRLLLAMALSLALQPPGGGAQPSSQRQRRAADEATWATPLAALSPAIVDDGGGEGVALLPSGSALPSLAPRSWSSDVARAPGGWAAVARLWLRGHRLLC